LLTLRENAAVGPSQSFPHTYIATFLPHYYPQRSLERCVSVPQDDIRKQLMRTDTRSERAV